MTPLKFTAEDFDLGKDAAGQGQLLIQTVSECRWAEAVVMKQAQAKFDAWYSSFQSEMEELKQTLSTLQKDIENAPTVLCKQPAWADDIGSNDWSTTNSRAKGATHTAKLVDIRPIKENEK